MNRRMSQMGTVGLLVGALLFVGSSSQAHSSRDRKVDLDLTASALPVGADAPVTDDVDDRAGSRHRKVKADTTAIASANCDGCTGDASALQVLYLDRPLATTLDNVATAAAQCADCRATAISVQVVVVRHAHEVSANNRALAVNAVCDHCESSALAFQLVVADDSGERLSHGAYRVLKRWVAEQAAALRGNGGAGSRGFAAPASLTGVAAIGSLENLVNDRLDSTTLVANADDTPQ